MSRLRVAGNAACVTKALATSLRTDAQPRMPFALNGQTATTLRFEADLDVDAPQLGQEF